MPETIHKLEWDSDFFCIPTAKLEFPEGFQLIDAKVDELCRQPYQLYYYQTKNEVSNWDKWTPCFDIVLGDTRLLYVKSELNPGAQDPAIQQVKPTDPFEPFIPLALEGASHSRYKRDPHFPENAFTKLYTEWIKKSINRTLAKDVLVYYVNGFPAGLLTIGIKNNRTDVGLLAVDPAFRGKGIAKALMQAADNWAVKAGFTSIQLTTQLENKTACALYDKLGYTIATTDYFYHIWKRTQ